MTKSAARKHASKGKPRAAPAPDGAVYGGLLLIGIFGVGLWYIFGGEGSWKHGVTGYLIAVLVLINLYTWRVYVGTHLLPWQQSLARLSLRWAGYGTKGGRPLDAAHGSRPARIMLVLTMITSVVVVALLAWLLYVR